LPPPKKKPEINPAMYLPIPTQTPYFPPQMNPLWPYSYSPQLVAPVIKQYSINDGPFVNYTTLSVVKEDNLPKHFDNTSNTLGERVNIYNFIRSVFIKHYDGEDIDLDGKGKNSLLSYLKFLELNPYSSSQYTDNPYKGLPDDMVIYRSCYPIRYDETTNTVQCALNSIGMNIRIYKMTHAEYNIKKSEQNNFYDFNIWREIAYYEYIREQVIKRKICPNFTLMYCYYISEKCNVDFGKVNRLKGKKYTVEELKADFKKSQDILQATKQVNIPSTIIQPVSTLLELRKDPYQQSCSKNSIVRTFNDNINTLIGKGLVVLTEAPTYNIYGWSSRTYKQEGNIHRMVNTGYHTSEVWMSVLFQIMVALYVLQLNKIAFNNFTIEDNVYIKDLTLHENIVTYWKYKINNFEYYVPNYGYLVMIDSNYKDIEGTQYTLIKQADKKAFKIYSNIFKDKLYDDDSLNKLCFESFKMAINPNTFTLAFTNAGGTPPPEDIRSLLSEIYNVATSQNAPMNIDYYIYRYMKTLLNNRIGTYLSELEAKNIRDGPVNPGEIVVYVSGSGIYQYALFLEEFDKDGIKSVKILIKNNPKDDDLVIVETTIDTLKKYNDVIVQNYKPNESNLNEEDLLETYVVN
jgi:hypothetical protein